MFWLSTIRSRCKFNPINNFKNLMKEKNSSKIGIFKFATKHFVPDFWTFTDKKELQLAATLWEPAATHVLTRRKDLKTTTTKFWWLLSWLSIPTRASYLSAGDILTLVPLGFYSSVRMATHRMVPLHWHRVKFSPSVKLHNGRVDLNGFPIFGENYPFSEQNLNSFLVSRSPLEHRTAPWRGSPAARCCRSCTGRAASSWTYSHLRATTKKKNA